MGNVDLGKLFEGMGALLEQLETAFEDGYFDKLFAAIERLIAAIKA